MPADASDISVLHCFRPLVGGVFRHVVDLVRGQSARGARVGVVCDSTPGPARAEATLRELADCCELGVNRLPIQRRVQLSDFATRRAIAQTCAGIAPAFVHGHGAKGGAFARLCAGDARVVYTPHGGVLHYEPGSLAGRIYFALERRLLDATHGLIFESRFGARQFAAKVVTPTVPSQVIHNGLHDDEFEPLAQDDPTFDFVFAGELRKLKGLEVLLLAMQKLGRSRAVSLLACGSGPDASHFERRIRKLDLEGRVTLRPAVTPVTSAFARARVVVVPSLSESFPYIVLEALAAGMPLVSTRAGGIGEIFGERSSDLVPTGDADALASAMASKLDDLPGARREAKALRERVRREFGVARMVDATIDFYRRLREP